MKTLRYNFDLVFTPRPKGLAAQLFFADGGSTFSIDKQCPPNSYLSIFTSNCQLYQCPEGFHTVNSFCIPDALNFSCPQYMFSVNSGSYRIQNTSLVQIYDQKGVVYSIGIEKIAKEKNKLIVCANYTLFRMFHTNEQVSPPAYLDAIFIVTGICSTAFLTTAMALILITVRKNSLTLISFNILLTLFFENLAMFPRVFTNDGSYVCIISAIIDHYCWIVLFSWVCALSYEEMHSQKLNMFQLYSRPQTWLYMILCWLSPIILVMINTVMHFLQFDWLLQIYGGQSCSVRLDFEPIRVQLRVETKFMLMYACFQQRGNILVFVCSSHCHFDHAFRVLSHHCPL